MSGRIIRIAVAQARDGHTACVGPDDFKSDDFNDAMDAAISWLIEAGWMPAAHYWIEVALPSPVDRVPTLQPSSISHHEQGEEL